MYSLLYTNLNLPPSLPPMKLTMYTMKHIVHTLLSLILSYGRCLSWVAMVILPVNPSFLKVSAHIKEAGPENKMMVLYIYNTSVSNNPS